jgi:LAO/AO transport system kinase
VGQTELDVVGIADMVVVVLVPESGDTVQTMKAGILEIGDIFVVNKADRPGADRTAGEIEAMLALGEFGAGAWRPPVLKTQATTGGGVTAVIEAVERFAAEHGESHERRRARARFRLTGLLQRTFIERLEQREDTRTLLADAVDSIAAGARDPYAAADDIMERVS